MHWGINPDLLANGYWAKSYAQQPAWLVLKTWVAHKRRHLEQIDRYSIIGAKICTLIEGAIAGLSGGKAESSFQDFLPFNLEDPNSPKAKLRKQVSRKTLKTLSDLHKAERIPPEIQRMLHDIPHLFELIEGANRN